MKKWAVIEDGIVVNTIFWDGESEWSTKSKTELVELLPPIESFPEPGIGWSYSDGVFFPSLLMDDDILFLKNEV